MSEIKSHTFNDGTWILPLVLFSIGIDGLAYLIYAKDRASAVVSIPILLLWQVIVFIHSCLGVLPTYRSLDKTDPKHSRAYVDLFQIALTLPAIVATVIWTMLPALLPIRH